MKNLITTLCVIYTFTLSYCQLTPHEAIELMGKGINLGNTLDGLPTEGSWYPNKAEEYYFKAYKDAGFTNIRIPVTWQEHFESDPFYKVNETWMNRVEEVVDWGLAQGLFITLNAHHDGWIKHEYTEVNIQKFDSLWSQIATRFKDKSDRLVFEMLNEPEDMTISQLNETNARILNIIRKTNPTRIVLFSGNGWTASDDLLEIDIPDVNDNYLMGYFHAYDPWDFIGGNSSWHGTTTEINSLESNMQKVQDWSIQNNIPVILNEWGATHSCDYNQKMKYLAIYGNIILEYGFAYSYWDDGGQFRLYEREDNKWDDVKDVLIHCNNHTPMNLTAVAEDSIVTLTWENRVNTDSVAIDSTVIERKTETIGLFNYFATTSDLQEFIDSSGKEAGKNYYYRVINYLADGSSLISYPQTAYIMCNERFTFGSEAITIPGTLEAENFDIGCNGLSYFDSDPTNKGNAYRLDEPVDIESRNDGGYQVGYVTKDEWLEYTIDVEESGEYTVTSLTATEKSGCLMTIEIDADEICRINIPNTNSWTTLQEVKTNINLEAGEQIMRLKISSVNPFNIDKLIFTQGHYNSGEISNYKTFNLYPNPASENIIITFQDNQESNRIVISDMKGQYIKEVNSVESTAAINISDLTKGVYLVTISNKRYSSSQKFIVN